MTVAFTLDHARADVFAQHAATAANARAAATRLPARIVTGRAANRAAAGHVAAVHGAASAAKIRAIDGRVAREVAAVAAHGAAAVHVVAALAATVAFAIEVTRRAARAFAQLTRSTAAGLAPGEGEQQRAKRATDVEIKETDHCGQRAQLQTVSLREHVSVKKSLLRTSSTSE